MLLDEMMETNQPSPSGEQQATEKAQKVCEQTLKSLGYEVLKPSASQQGVDFTIKKGTNSYSLFVTFADAQSETHFRIPVGSLEAEADHIFNSKADCIAFYQMKHDGGTIFQFKLESLRELIKPLVARLKENKAFAFHAHNAIAMKRIHAAAREDGVGYVMYVYLPIEAVCKNLKNTKQRVGK